VTSAQAQGTSDATMSTLSVRHADGTVQSVCAYALGIAGGYPRGLIRVAPDEDLVR